MNWMPKCNSWNFLVCQKCCLVAEHYGASFFFSPACFLAHMRCLWGWESANIKYVRIECFRFSCTPDACLVLRFDSAFSIFGWVFGQFLEDHPKGCFTTFAWGCARPIFVVCVENSMCCALGKVILSWQVCTHFRVWPTKRFMFFVWNVEMVFSVASWWPGFMLDPECRFSGLGLWCEGVFLSCCVTLMDLNIAGFGCRLCGNESALVVLKRLWWDFCYFAKNELMWRFGCVKPRKYVDVRGGIRWLVLNLIRENLYRRHRRCATKCVTANAVHHALRHGFFFPPGVTLSEACVLPTGCVIRSCGLRSERVSHGKFFQGCHACGSIVRDRINCWSMSGFADLVVSAIFLDGFGVPEVFTSAIQVIVVDVHE